MKLKDSISPTKLRGGFYTPDHIVDFCISRIRELNKGVLPQTWLEPSVGDGAFIRGLARQPDRPQSGTLHFTGVELDPEEAGKAGLAHDDAAFDGCVINSSFFAWALESDHSTDALVGNPPFVRYQFVDQLERASAENLLDSIGLDLHGVSNLWIPFAILSLSRIRVGGCFALVLPSELFSTTSGGQFREYFVRHFSSLQVDLFPRGTFADILQDVVVVSGRKARQEVTRRPIVFCEHSLKKSERWSHSVIASGDSWTRYLLREAEYGAYVDACALAGFHQLGSIARLGVAVVTGANSFFTVTDSIRDAFGLSDWTIPLLARTSDCPGVVYTSDDHESARRAGSRTWLLDFSESRPKPNGKGRVSEYLAMGEAEGLPDRYKCRIREPWYRVPHVWAGRLMMTKRAHHYHRLLLNEANVVTTDTVYRGEMIDLYRGRERDLVAYFQNTLTLLSSEIEGRSYGGGVLELVPSELAKLVVPLLKPPPTFLATVDKKSRRFNGQKDSLHTVMRQTDAGLSTRVDGYSDLLTMLGSARERLMARRQST